MYSLPESYATVAVPFGYILLAGKETERLGHLHDMAIGKHVEACAYRLDASNEIIRFRSFDKYTPIEYWEQLNPKELLKSVTKATEEFSDKRSEHSFDSIGVIGWLQKPTVNRHTNTVHWATEARLPDGSSSVNAVILRLGNQSYEEIRLATTNSRYFSDYERLSAIATGFSVETGFGYNDEAICDAEFLRVLIVGMAKLIDVSFLFLALRKLEGAIIFMAAMLIYWLKELAREQAYSKYEMEEAAIDIATKKLTLRLKIVDIIV